MSEVILPPIETEPELPEEQLPEIDKPTELSKVITIKFNPLDTGMTSTANTRQSFYTTDTDAWVTFEIENMEAPNGEYSLVLYNKSDGSVFQRTGDIVSGAAYYKIEEEEIKHAGDWVGQVVITLVNGKTTTSRFSFNVAGHLLDGKDVRQIVIQDFETLMKQLNGLKDDAEIDFRTLKNDIEESQRVAEQNELERVSAENERKQAELLRDEKYDSKVDAAIVKADVVTKVNDKVAELSPTIQNVTTQLQQNNRLTNASSKSFLSVKNIEDMSYTNANGFLLLWMDEDGVIYARKEKGLYESVDNGNTYNLLYTFEQSISGVRSVEDGELIVSIEKTTTQNARVYKSSLNKKNYKLVLTATSIEVSYHGGWGMDVKGKNVVISEYGKYGHAVHAFLSKDGGNTFTQIIDLTTVNQQSTIPHIHGIAYDEFFDRVWIAHGDHNGNVYYTDDFGLNWVQAYSSSQLLNIFVLDDCVLFGSDSSPNGIFRYNRGRKEDVAVIELAYKLDDFGSITYIPYSTYRRDNKSPVIMTWMFMEGFSQPTGSKIIISTFDGQSFQKIWTDTGEHDVSQIITAYGPTNDGKLIGTQKGDNRFADGTSIKGSLNFGFMDNMPVISSEYKNQSKRPYVDVRTLGVIGNGTDETIALEKAINFAGDRHLTLIIPRHMTVFVKSMVVKNKKDFDILCYGSIKMVPLTSGSIADALKFINCSNVNIPIINFDGNSENSGGSTHQKLHNFLILESCNDVNIGEINAKKVVGNVIDVEKSSMVFVDKIKATSSDKGANLVIIRDSITVKVNKIVSKGVSDNSFTSNLILIEPLTSTSVIEDITFRNVDIETIASRVITVKNTIGAKLDTISFEKTRIVTKGTTLLRAAEFTGVNNLKTDIDINTNQSVPSNYNGIGVYLDDIKYLDCTFKVLNVASGLYLGEKNKITDGKLKLIVSDVKTACVHLGKMENMTVESDLNNSLSLNITVLSGNNLKNILMRNSKFRKGTNNYRNINLFNAVCDNVLFKDNDFSEWTTLVEKLEINLPGVRRVDNLGLNYLSSAPNDSRYWNSGEIVYNTKPVSGGYIGWICITSGTPGVWKGFGLIEA